MIFYFSQLSSNDRLEFLTILQLLLKTAVESSDGKNEILQLEFLSSGLAKVDRRSLRFSTKPSWIESDSIWFDLISLKNLFNENDSLYHLSDLILSNDQTWNDWYKNPRFNSIPNPKDQQFSSIEKLLIVRLLHPNHFLNTLREYLIEEFHLNQILVNKFDFSGINIVTIPSIPVKSIHCGEFLVNEIDLNKHLEKILGEKVRSIDCQLINEIPSLTNDQQIILLKNISEEKFSSIIKQIRRMFFHLNEIKKDLYDFRSMSE